MYDPSCENEQFQIHDRPCSARGKYAPYLGSQTTEKKTGTMIPLPRSTPSLIAAQRISQVLFWAFADDLITQSIIRSIIRCRTNLSPEVLILSSGYVYGESLTHRYNDPMTSHEVLTNLRPNFLTHLHISSDTLQEYSRGAVDVTMHFQGMFLMGAALLHIENTISDNYKHRSTLHAHVKCKTCTKEIVDEKVKLGPATLEYPRYDECPLLYTEISDEINNEIISIENVVLITNLNPADVLKDSSDAAACMLESNHRQIMSSSFRGRSELIVCPGTRGLDIQEFMAIGFPRLVKSLAKICIMDRADHAFDLFRTSIMDIERCFMVSVQRTPHSLWCQLRSHLILPEATKWLLTCKHFLPSTEAWKGGSSLDLTLSRILAFEVKKQLKTLAEKTHIKFTLFVTSSFSQLRHIQFWINKVIIYLLLQREELSLGP